MKILYICTHNRCRSILAEAITNHSGKGTLHAKSAGSQPAGEVYPLTLKYLQEKGIDTSALCSQSWDVHEAWRPDVVVMVCDSAAGETCPVWLGDSIRVHWGLPDPSSVSGTDAEIAAAFHQVIAILTDRIGQLSAIDFGSKSREEVTAVFQQLANS